jgi:hypothetical protein
MLGALDLLLRQAADSYGLVIPGTLEENGTAILPQT